MKQKFSKNAAASKFDYRRILDLSKPLTGQECFRIGAATHPQVGDAANEKPDRTSGEKDDSAGHAKQLSAMNLPSSLVLCELGANG